MSLCFFDEAHDCRAAEQRGSATAIPGAPAILILRSTGIELRFQLKPLKHKVDQVIPTGKDHIPH
jgi:hypothetical protein